MAHMFRSVLGNTLVLVLQKFDELSKPEIPNIAAEKPKKSALTIPPEVTGRLS
jgi:hypothetical protein